MNLEEMYKTLEATCNYFEEIITKLETTQEAMREKQESYYEYAAELEKPIADSTREIKRLRNVLTGVQAEAGRIGDRIERETEKKNE